MKLATIRTPDGTRAVRVSGDDLVELAYADVGELLRAKDWRSAASATTGTRHALDGADFAPVVVAPPKVICLGMNYRSHVEEMGREIPDHPTLFAKYARSLIGAHDPIVLPPESSMVDWEVELAIVIGAEGRRVRAAEAGDVMAGFTVLNDISMRDFQFRSMQFLQGKTWDHSTPVGPWMVTADECGAAPDLELRCEVDGELMQQARTSDLIWSPPQLIEYISTIVTLSPGDVIATGTPGGVGAGRNPPVFLKPGQIVRTTIGGIGTLENRCVAEII